MRLDQWILHPLFYPNLSWDSSVPTNQIKSFHFFFEFTDYFPMYQLLQVQCSYAPSRPLYWKRKIESKRVLAAFPKVKRTYGILSKHKSSLCIGVPLIHGSNQNSRKTSSCKMSMKSSIKVSYLPQDSKETLYDVPKVQTVDAPVTIESDGMKVGSLAVQKLFKSWLTLLRMPSPHQVTEGTLEGPFLNKIEIVEAEDKVQNNGRNEILKMVWCNFLGLHPAIKIPAMIFMPMYVAVNIKYGMEIAKELTPLWIGGPLVMALYITMLQVITSLYIFSFKQSVKVLQKSTTAYDYVACGKMNEMIRVRLWTPMVDFWNLGYIQMSKRTQKDFEMWLVDKYMDYVESIWPSYCKLIRFLKRANFI